ncbi:MAG: lipid A export permease/ATP-binding protein MsbA [Xanthomonadales bacterium]|nr:lipid A export permease/ATP-binding protein MsbA [Xanthomonadales bacterium]
MPSKPVSPSAADTQSRQSSWRIYLRLLRQAKAYRWIMLLAIVGMLADALAQSTFIYLLKPLVDDAFSQRESSVAEWLPLAIFGLILLRTVGHFTGVYSVEWTGRRLIADLRQRLFSHYLHLPLRFFQNHSSGNLISRITYNTEQVAQAATNGTITLVRDTLTTIGLFTVMFIQSPLLTVALLIMAPVVAIVVRVVSRRFRHLSHQIQDTMGEVTQVAEEAVNGYQVVKIYGGETQENERFAKANEGSRKLQLRLTANRLSSSTVIQWCAGLALMAILWLATQSPWASTISAGVFMSVLSAMMAVIAPLKRLATVHAVLQKGVAAAESIYDILDLPTEDPGGEYRSPRSQGDIKIEQLSFHYEPEVALESGELEPVPVLHDVSVHLKPGTVTALVGRSGSGKSTLAALLTRFYDPQQGRILLDDVDIRDWQRTALRAQMAYVGQEVMLFNDSIRNNIAYGQSRALNETMIQAAAKAAHVLEFTQRLPEQLETTVGDRGHRLSGGERQRLAIARALLKQAPVLILDEATSALDNESEKLIQDALQNLLHDQTTLVIAHRLSTVEQADQILVMDQGRIVQAGRHEALLAEGGLYADLYHRRFNESGS